ncbi:MAG: HD domain-containing protein [Desulfobacterales bacterium]|nr:HD domain-containing protein [Desulfobacterales bacterium]
MDQKTLDSLKKWFSEYARRFGNDDADFNKNIALKIRHTGRVHYHTVKLAGSLKLAPADKRVAEAVALLHDVGRFRQLQRYNTFDDRASVDHAALALRVIEEEGALARLADPEQTLIRVAVGNHNKLHLPEEANERELFFLKIIRDADKLDIFDLIVENYQQEKAGLNPAIDFGLDNTPGYEQQYIDDILHNRICDNRFLKNSNDVKLMRLSWIFDLNFAYSFAYVRRSGYLDNILKHLPATGDIHRISSHLAGYLDAMALTAPIKGTDGP